MGQMDQSESGIATGTMIKAYLSNQRASTAGNGQQTDVVGTLSHDFSVVRLVGCSHVYDLNIGRLNTGASSDGLCG